MSWLFRSIMTKKKSEFKRIECNSAKKALAEAMENAGRMKTVLILYETHDDDPSPGGIITQEGVLPSAMNWLIDQAKLWLLT